MPSQLCGSKPYGTLNRISKLYMFNKPIAHATIVKLWFRLLTTWSRLLQLMGFLTFKVQSPTFLRPAGFYPCLDSFIFFVNLFFCSPQFLVIRSWWVSRLWAGHLAWAPSRIGLPAARKRNLDRFWRSHYMPHGFSIRFARAQGKVPISILQLNSSCMRNLSEYKGNVFPTLHSSLLDKF